MIPSVSQRRGKPWRACASVTDTYSARPDSFYKSFFVPPPPRPPPRRPPAHDADGLVAVERVEEADSVGAAADAGDGVVREPALRVQHLLARLRADDQLEVADDHRVGVRP